MDTRAYYKEAAKRAWKKTWNLLGWSKQKFVAGFITLLALVVGGGAKAGFTLITSSWAAAIALAIVLPLIFVWSLIEAQADLYQEAIDVKDKDGVAAAARRNMFNRPAPDYEKWRHVPTLTLQQAAQLWAGQRPATGISGDAKDTYAMLCGAVQNGELAFVDDPRVEPRMIPLMRERIRNNPQADTKVMRGALQKFAAQYGYTPEFLKER